MITSPSLPPFPTTLDAVAQGRDAFDAWRAAIPANFYLADVNLQRQLQMYLGDAGYAAEVDGLTAFGAKVIGVIDPAARLNDEPDNHPTLQRWDAFGRRTESIIFHPSYHMAGRPAYEAGILHLSDRPGSALVQSAYFYLLTQSGEMGHACPIVCAMGLIRALLTVGDDALQTRYLPPLLARDYERKHTAAQFLTEIQGGSDVGANATQAIRQGDGTWRIRGEKWFCSVANADQMLVTARPQGAAAGSKGLGVFLVPRTLADGSLNKFYIRRLKTKFGTRTMASAEIDFIDAVAYPIGDITDGIHIVTELVLNTSRWANAIGSAGLLRRAYVESWTFAQHRRAFDDIIAHYPLVAETLLDMKVTLSAMLAGTMRLSHLIDRMDLGLATQEERAVHRLLVTINKYVTSVQASMGIRKAQELLGGNGAIEDFSIIPRLYRDSVVFESWEGSHNVLCLQALRDMQRYELHEHLFNYLESLLTDVTAHSLFDVRLELTQHLDKVRAQVQTLLEADASFQQLHIRRIVDRLGILAQAICLLSETAWEVTQALPTSKPDHLQIFIDQRLRRSYDPMTDLQYYDRVMDLAPSL